MSLGYSTGSVQDSHCESSNFSRIFLFKEQTESPSVVPWTFSCKTCIFWRHLLTSEHICRKVLKWGWNTHCSLTAATGRPLSGYFMFAVRRRWTCWRCHSGNAAVIIVVHVYCRRLVTQLDFKLWGTQRRMPGRHRDVDEASRDRKCSSGTQTTLQGYSNHAEPAWTCLNLLI